MSSRVVGATLAVVTPETRDFPRQLKRDLDLKVLSDIDYGVGVSYGVLFRVPDETKAHYSGPGFDLGPRQGSPDWMPAHSRDLRDRHRRPDPQRVRGARLHDTRGTGVNLGLAAPGRFHVLAGRPAIQRRDLAIQTSRLGCADSGRDRRTSRRSRAAALTLSLSEGAPQAALDSSIASSDGATLEDGVRRALARYSDGSLP